MKKFLSLALALVMTMSLVTVSAGAKDFTDDSKITYDEAVAVISEIGVVDGYTDGAFNPQNNLTRGAAAKIICNLVLGPTTASALSADAAPFSDVPATHEFAGYIAYCSQQGIINGYADGTFKPAGTLTGYHFMKMLLGALGYDGEVEGFTGANWTVNVAKLALGVGLDDGNDDFSGNAYVNREEACLYAFNTLQADMVDYDSKTTVSVGGSEVVISGSKAEVMAQAPYKDTMGEEETLQFAEKYFDKLTKTGTDHDPFGRPANEWRYKANVIGTYADYSDLEVSYDGVKAPKGELYSKVGSGIIDDLQTSSASKDYYFSVWVDGKQVANPDPDNYFDKNSTGAAGTKNAIGKGNVVGQSGNGVLTEVFVDDDSNVTIVMVNTYLVQATADYNSSKEEVAIQRVENNDDDGYAAPSLGSTISQDDFDVENVKEDDYLLVTYSYDEEDIQSVTPAELKTGTVSEYTTKDSVVVDGTNYKYNKLVGDNYKDSEFSIGSDATVVMDSYGYILYVDEANSTNSYVYVSEFGSNSSLNAKALAQAYFTDGTDDEIVVKKVGTVENKSTIANYGTTMAGWYTFTKNSSDEYTLNTVKAPRTTGTLKFAAVPAADQQIVYGNVVKFLNKGVTEDCEGDTDAAKALRGNEDTIFVTLDSDDNIDVYTGVSNAPDVTLSKDAAKNDNGVVKVSWVADKSGYAKFVFIDVKANDKADVDGGNNVADYMLLLYKSTKKTVVDGSTFYKYDVLIDGQVETRFIESDSVIENEGDLGYNVRLNSDDYVSKVSDFASSTKSTYKDFDLSSATISQKSGTITVDGHSFIVASDSKLFLAVDDNAPELMKNDGLDYETYLDTTAGTIASVTEGYAVDGKLYVVVDEDDNEKIDYLYLWISEAVATDGKDAGNDDDAEAVIKDVVSSDLTDSPFEGATSFIVNGLKGEMVDGVLVVTGTITKGYEFAPDSTDEVPGFTDPEGEYKVMGDYAADGSTDKMAIIPITVGDDLYLWLINESTTTFTIEDAEVTVNVKNVIWA